MGFQVIQGNEPLPRPGLYMIEHVLTGRRYVGISMNVKKRLREHERGTGKGALAVAVKTLGAASFVGSPLFYATMPIEEGDSFLGEIEAQAICDLAAVEIGFNVRESSVGGSPLGMKFRKIMSEARRTKFQDPEFRSKEIERLRIASATPEARKKAADGNRKHFQDHPERRARMAELAKARFTGAGNPNFGKPMPDAVRARLSASRTGITAGEKHPLFGKHHTEETRRKISDARKSSEKCRGKNHYTYGKKFSTERLAQMSAHMMGKWVGDDNPMRKEHNKRTCEHCGMRMAVNTFARYHGEKCKKRPGG